MNRYRITGIDRDSGFQTTIVVEAESQTDAESAAIGRGIAPRRIQPVDPAVPPFMMPPPEFWHELRWTIAQGVALGAGLFILSLIVLGIVLWYDLRN